MNGFFYALDLSFPAIEVGVRIMHDIDKEWWYILISIYNIYWFTIEGEKGANQYGAGQKNQL